jgi:hypothetical protein
MSPGAMKSNRKGCFSRFAVISNSALLSLLTETQAHPQIVGHQ